MCGLNINVHDEYVTCIMALHCCCSRFSVKERSLRGMEKIISNLYLIGG